MKQVCQALKVFVAACGIAIIAFTATAEVAVSVTITGSLEEVLPILEQLNTLRGGQEASTSQDGRVTIQSVANFDPSDADALETPEPAVAEADTPRFNGVSAGVSRTGADVLLLVDLVDPDQEVDTLVGVVDLGGMQTFDFFDNGNHGDIQAGDGTWSYTLAVPYNSPPSTQLVHVTAYDALGMPIKVRNDEGQLEDLVTTIPCPVGTPAL